LKLKSPLERAEERRSSALARAVRTGASALPAQRRHCSITVMVRKKAQESKNGASGKAKTSRKGAKEQSAPKTTRASKASPGSSKSKSLHDFSPTLGELDLHLFGQGRHEHIYEKLGAHVLTHEGKRGVAFAVWAPNARSVSVVGDFNEWDGARHPMRNLGSSGVWELFIPGLRQGQLYKYEIKSGRHKFLKADPYALMMEIPPNTSSVVFKSEYKFRDRAWLTQLKKRQAWREPLSIYEVHFGSWRRITEDNNRPLTYREMAPLLADYAIENGFTRVRPTSSTPRSMRISLGRGEAQVTVRTFKGPIRLRSQ